MAISTSEVLRYYTQPGIMTDPRQQAERFDGLPTDIGALCAHVQGLLLHVYWAPAYGVTLPPERQAEMQLRSMDEMLARLRAIDDQPLTVARPVERRLGSVCRHFSTMLCTMLQHHHIPARARCGFGAYFNAGTYEDHWVCEYWNAAQERWVLVDAQLDAVQRAALQITFDPRDVPRDQFIIAGQAWQMCRRGDADPGRFGIFDMRGLWFIRGNVLRDLACLNRLELLPWDAWGLMSKTDPESAEELALLDRIAALTLADNAAFGEMQALYEGDARLRVPRVIDSYRPDGIERIELPLR